MQHAEKLKRHTHTHLIFPAHARASLHKSYHIPMTTHVGKHTCTHAAASLNPIKWALCVQRDGLPGTHASPFPHTHPDQHSEDV